LSKHERHFSAACLTEPLEKHAHSQSLVYLVNIVHIPFESGEFIDWKNYRLSHLQAEMRTEYKKSKFESKHSPQLAAGTIKWGFQRGRASPLVACGVNTP
jgi:hypothetical protein